MIRRALYRLTAGLRCRLISRDGRPYLERYYLGRLGPVTAYLHRIAAAEPDTWTLFMHGLHRKRWGFVRYVAANVDGPACTLYHQPFPPWRGEDWAAAPLGRDAGRQPMGEGA